MDLTPLISRLSIQTKNLTVEQLRPNWAQQQYLDTFHEQVNNGRPARNIVLKARQLGISTITEAVVFALAFVNDGLQGLVVAHELEASEHLLGITNLYWETYPFRNLYTPRYASKKHLSWAETRSGIRITTAKNVRAGRGRTISALHASEVAFWDDPDTTMLGLQQAIPSRPGTFISLESTANGVGGYFYEVWNAAVAGDVDYEPLFFPWHKHPEYTASWIGIPYENLADYDSEEKVLRNIGVSDDRLAWRRWAIKNLTGNDVNQFHQEYPTTPEEAFVATGTNVFPIERLARCYQPKEGRPGRLVRDGTSVTFQPDVAGPLRIFSTPATDRDWGKYFIGGDPTHTPHGDPAVAQVINRRTYEQVAVWRGRTDPMSFAEELAKLGRYYNDAYITTEVEGPGYATVGRLMEMDYPYIWRHRWADKQPGKIAETFGWSTTFKRKQWAISFLLKLVVDGDITIHDRTTFMEMRDYVTLPNGGYGPAVATGHDDTVMALAIDCICAATESPLLSFGQETATLLPVEAPWESWGDSDGTNG